MENNELKKNKDDEYIEIKEPSYGKEILFNFLRYLLSVIFIGTAALPPFFVENPVVSTVLMLVIGVGGVILPAFICRRLTEKYAYSEIKIKKSVAEKYMSQETDNKQKN